MRIELSLWETVDASLSSRRRRRPTEENGASSAAAVVPGHHNNMPAFSFVRNQRVRTTKKARTLSKSATAASAATGSTTTDPSSVVEDAVHAFLVLTSDTKIVLVGNHHHKGNALAVSSTRQYSCRPGTSFVATANASVPPVSAVFDKRNDLMFALQKENTRLVCWPSLSSTPDDGVSTILEDGYAVSLNVTKGTQYPVMYGTMMKNMLPESSGDTSSSRSSSLFLARYDPSDKKLVVKSSFDAPPSLQQPKDADNGKHPLQHVATFDLTQQLISNPNTDNTPTKTGKRKADGDAKSDGIVFVEVFANARTFYVVRNEIAMENEADLTSFERKKVSVSEVPLDLHCQDSAVVSTVSLVGVDSRNHEFVLSYQTASGSQYFVTLSTNDGKICAGPFDIGGQARRMSLGESRLVVAQMADCLVFLDATTGAALQRMSPKDENDTWSKQWTLIGFDTKRTRILALVEGENGYSVASVRFTAEETDSWRTTSSLASRLVLSLESRVDYQAPILRRQDILDRDNGEGGYSELGATRNGMEMLEIACTAIENDVPGCTDEGFLSSAFARALETMVRSSKNIPEDVEGDTRRCSPRKQNMKLNDVHESIKEKENKTPEKPMNGKKPMNGHVTTVGKKKVFEISKNLRKVPSSLVTNIGALVVRILLVQRDIGATRNEARSVLRKVVRSKKVSARNLFGSSGRATLQTVLKSLERKETEEFLAYSPVELLFDLFGNFRDVSERFMVVGAQYMLMKASPLDLADYFTRTQVLSELCGHFWRLQKDSADAQEVEACSSRLLLRGSEAFMAGILTYSDCNETLLRRSISENLSRGEVIVFLKLVSNVRQVADTQKFDASTWTRAFLWTSTLCSRLRSPRSEEETSVLEKTHLSIASERNATSLMLGIQDTVESAIADINEATSTSAGTRKEKQNRAQLPPYQLERLVL